jgi:glucosamine 6-phosphate synthetase-like amidotransferase/phosphosugar isomerase protein
MCGLYGVMLSKLADDKSEVIPASLISGLHYAAICQGRDAWGYVNVLDSGVDTIDQSRIFDLTSRKKPGHVLELPNLALSLGFFGHTRAATIGNPSNNLNNHPVESMDENILVMHNGSIDEDIVFNMIECRPDPVRYGEVDSQSIAELLSNKYNQFKRSNLTPSDRMIAWARAGSSTAGVLRMLKKRSSSSSTIVAFNTDVPNAPMFISCGPELCFKVYENYTIYASRSEWMDRAIMSSIQDTKSGKLLKSFSIPEGTGFIYDIDKHDIIQLNTISITKAEAVYV